MTPRPTDGQTPSPPLARKYAPHLPRDEWAAIEDFVHESVTACAEMTSYPHTQLLGSAARLARWAWRSGLPLERDVVFRRSTIGLFVEKGCAEMAKTTRGTYRSRLLRMGEVLAPEHQEHRLPGLSLDFRAAPYTRAEQASLRSWASGQRTSARRADARALLALGLGAGLSGGEIIDVRRGHLTTDGVGVLVEVIGRRPRTVPVLMEWEDELAAWERSDVGPETFVFRSNTARPNTNVIAHFMRGDGDEPSTSRMRTTWIVGHLAAGIPARVLITAAGVDSFTAFQRCIPYLPDPDHEQARELLRRAAPSHDR